MSPVRPLSVLVAFALLGTPLPASAGIHVTEVPAAGGSPYGLDEATGSTSAAPVVDLAPDPDDREPDAALPELPRSPAEVLDLASPGLLARLRGAGDHLVDHRDEDETRAALTGGGIEIRPKAVTDGTIHDRLVQAAELLGYAHGKLKTLYLVSSGQDLRRRPRPTIRLHYPAAWRHARVDAAGEALLAALDDARATLRSIPVWRRGPRFHKVSGSLGATRVVAAHLVLHKAAPLGADDEAPAPLLAPGGGAAD